MKWQKHPIGLVLRLSSIAFCGVAQAGWDEGVAAGSKGDFATAMREFKPLAVQGDPRAQYSVGMMYFNGQQVLKDSREAAKWYQMASAQGADYAQVLLGSMYEKGEGVRQDYKEAMRLYRQAAEQGNVVAQLSIGKMHLAGYGVMRDDTEAVKWWGMAAAQGDTTALWLLGGMFESGDGVGGSKNLVIAYALYNLSATFDDGKTRTRLIKTMQTREIEAGQALSRELSRPGNFLCALTAVR